MLRDVFYYGTKPNVHPREKFATSLEDARQQSTTEHFWIINEYCDYRGFDWDFDFEFLPDEDVWAEEHNNVWPSTHQKDCGTWLCPKEKSEIIIYRADVNPVKRKNEKNSNWVFLDTVDETKFDFSWHPDPTDPPYIYVWGNKWHPVELQPVLEYHTAGAVERKYMDQVLELLPSEYFVEILPINKAKFDLSWRPDPIEPPLVYVWGSKYNEASVEPVIEYRVPGATDRKYMSQPVEILPDMKNWEIISNVDTTKFDFSWRPNPTSPPYIYVWGNKWNPVELQPALEYHVPNAVDRKYMDDVVELLPNEHFVEILSIDKSKFDLSWTPDPREPPYIYVWGSKWHPVELQPVLEYHTLDAVDRKYMDEIVELLPNKHFVEIIPIDKSKFDMSWIPDPREPPFIYVWGSKWNLSTIEPVLEYHVPNAVDRKYMDEVVELLPNRTNWAIPDDVDVTDFDFTWRPDLTSPPYIYQFGTQWQKTGGPKYIVPTATEIKYVDHSKAKRLPNKDNWIMPNDLYIAYFDFSWHPDETEEPYLYHFGTQWTEHGGPTYVRPGAIVGVTDTKYISPSVLKAIAGPDKKHWQIAEGIDTDNFDFSWHPHPSSPPYIYQFGTLVDKNDGPRYVCPDAPSDPIVYLERVDVLLPKVIPQYTIETTLADLVNQHTDEIFWALHKNIDYATFNFEWRPEIVNIQWENEYVYVFGSPDSEITQTYFVNANMYLKGYSDFKFVQTEELTEKYLTTLFKKSDMFFVDKGNKESQARYEQLKQKFPYLQKTRYLNSWVDTINRCINRSTTELCWILNSELDYIDFDFEYYPNPWQMKMVHIFGTQWNHWGTTYLVNKETFTNDTKYIKVVEHLSNLNFVKQRRAKATDILYDIVYIDHGNKDLSGIDNLIVKYDTSYLNTFRSMLDKLTVKKEHYVWIVSTICDYTNFDFTYICDPFAKEQLHVFPSDKQKFGDTFLIDVNKLRSLINDINKLEDFNKINFNQTQRVKRLSAPIIISEGDSHVSSIDTEFEFPYAVFVTEDNKNINTVDTEPMNLWSNETKNITITSKGGTRIVVPKEVKQHVKRELYDYPYISTNSKLIESNPLDIVFFSNGEACADENYKHLLNITKGLPNKVTRIDGINGRVKSQHAAATSSSTPWYFLVNAKLRVDTKFDFSWQPDRLQIPKHYIFHATNPVNGLVYGHQATVANNKKLTLANFGNGLDFTMDSEHEVVPINSGIGMYNSSEWDTWRTAFRECIKLKASNTQENKERLDIWLNVGKGEFSQYSIQGAKDAVEYYYEVGGDFDKLRLSYDWAWLESYYRSIQ